MIDLLLKGIPCPKCGELYYGLPYCRKCDWYDKEFDEWSKGHIKALWKLYHGSVTKAKVDDSA